MSSWEYLDRDGKPILPAMRTSLVADEDYCNVRRYSCGRGMGGVDVSLTWNGFADMGPFVLLCEIEDQSTVEYFRSEAKAVAAYEKFLIEQNCAEMRPDQYGIPTFTPKWEPGYGPSDAEEPTVTESIEAAEAFGSW